MLVWVYPTISCPGKFTKAVKSISIGKSNMSEYSSLKATINANIKANNNQEITGSIMNSVLTAMVNSLGAGYQFIGLATPTNPGSNQTPDYNCFYLVIFIMCYSNFIPII